MSEQGHYEVTLHRGPGLTIARATFPFGQWAEIGFWLDEIGAGRDDSLAVTFHPLDELPQREGSITCQACGAVTHWANEEAEDCLRCGRRFTESAALYPAHPDEGLHSVRSTLHEGAGLLDLEQPEPLRRLGMDDLLRGAGLDPEVYETNLRGLSYELGLEKYPQWEDGQDEFGHGLGEIDGGDDDPSTRTED